MLERAQVLGWPRVSLMDGKYVRGRDAWPLRVRGALPETLAAMETGLESLAAERDEART